MDPATPAIPVVPAVTPLELDDGPTCFKCGYDLRGRSGKTCPECGTEIDEEKLRRELNPWVRRKEIGYYRAARKTMRIVTFNTRQFCFLAAFPVDLKQALAFRRLVVIANWLPIVLLALSLVYLRWGELPRIEGHPYEAFFKSGLPWYLAVVSPVLFALFLYTVTGLHTYCFHPRHLIVRRQNQTVAMSYYLCAPLLLPPLMALLVTLAVSILLLFIFGLMHLPYVNVIAEQWVWGQLDVDWSLLIAILAGLTYVCLLPIAVVLFLRAITIALHRAALRSRSAVMLQGLMLPAGWLSLLLAFAGLIPALMIYVWVIINSF